MSCTSSSPPSLAAGTVPYYASDNYYARGGHATSYLVRKVRAGCSTAKVSSVDEIARAARRAASKGLTGDFGVGRVGHRTSTPASRRGNRNDAERADEREKEGRNARFRGESFVEARGTRVCVRDDDVMRVVSHAALPVTLPFCSRVNIAKSVRYCSSVPQKKYDYFLAAILST